MRRDAPSGEAHVWGNVPIHKTHDHSGTPVETQPMMTPAHVPQLRGVVELACGLRHFVAVTSTGQLFTWGRSYEGALGHGGEPETEQFAPKPIQVRRPTADASNVRFCA